MKWQVLLLADSPLLTGILMLQLTEEGFDVTALDSSESMAERLMSQEPDLVILDLPLPDRHGAELAARLCLRRKIPLMVLAAPGTSQVVGDRLQGAHVLVKPFSVDRLLGRIGDALGGKRSASVA